MSDLELRQAYERLHLLPDADQEEIRRAYLKLRQELDGEDLRLLYTAWENLWSPQNRVRVDALLFQIDQEPPSIEHLQATLAPVADKVDWQSLIERDNLVKQEAATVTSLILERTWLGHSYSTLFGRAAPVAETATLPKVTLTPITQATRPPIDEGVRQGDVRPQRGGLYRPAWALALLGVLVLGFAMLRGNLPAALSALNLTPRNTASSTAIASPVFVLAIYEAPSMAYVVPTLTPIGYRPILASQSAPITPLPAMTAPIDSVALIDQIRERIQENTEAVENGESDFAQSILFGAVQPAQLLSIAPTNFSESPQATPSPTPLITPTATPSPTPTSTPEPEPTATSTVQPITLQSRTYTNVRSGPGVEFNVVEIIEPDTVRTVLARTQDSTWLRIQTTSGNEGWVASLVVDVNGLMQGIEVQTD